MDDSCETKIFTAVLTRFVEKKKDIMKEERKREKIKKKAIRCDTLPISN